MRRYFWIACLLIVLAGCDNSADIYQKNAKQSADNATEKIDHDIVFDAKGRFANSRAKNSYALGMDVAQSVSSLPADINAKAFVQGIKDTLEGDEVSLNSKEAEQVLARFIDDIKTAQQEQNADQAQLNLTNSQQFLEENAKKDGVKTTASGLQYEIIEAGDGRQPGRNDSVTVHYQGELIDGTVFDDSHERGEAITFPVSSVIPGWTEALQLMKEGATYKLYIPPKLAYGEQGAGNMIGPNQALIFTVELQKVRAANE